MYRERVVEVADFPLKSASQDILKREEARQNMGLKM
jgi:hypothetical protein